MKFRTKLVGAGALLAFAAHGPAWAQEPPAGSDPIGALLEQPQEAPADPNDPEAEPSTATTPEAPPAAAPAPFVPQTPASPPPAVRYDVPPVNHAPGSSAVARPPAATYTPTPAYTPPAQTPAPYYAPPPPPPRPTEPVNIDELGKTPDYPPNPTDLNYEARLRASSASAQGLQGPLDGPWTLRTSGGRELYSLLLVDNAQGLEGAWRDPRRRGATDASGFLNAIQRTGGGIVITFYPAPGAGLATVTLNPSSDGSWSGDLEEHGDRQHVTLRRN